MFQVPEEFRQRKGLMGSTQANGNNGVFVVKSIKFKRQLLCQASDGGGWEHVSVSLNDRCPNWEEMSFIKALFWDEDDMVIQFHPPKSDYVNFHPYCLHLWRKAGTNDFCDMPPAIFVGPQAA